MYVRCSHRSLWLWLLAVAVVLAGCRAEPRPEFSRDVELLLASGESHVTSLAVRPADALTDGEVIQLGYLERLRLGLGSPFRLIEYALHDRRLEPEQQELLAYGILSRLLRGQAYDVDPAVLDLLRLRNASGAADIGMRHLRLIERTIAAAPTSGTGERAVRIGYGIAEAERLTAAAPQGVVTQIAALVADRRRAQHDATDVLRAASALDEDPLELIARWRRERRLRVERPAQTPINLRWEAFEARRGEELANELRLLAQRLSAPGAAAGRPRDRSPQATYLPLAVARRLQELARVHHYPAQAPVAVAVSMNLPALHALAGDQSWHTEAVTRFASTAVSEEPFAAAFAELRALDAVNDVQLSLVAMQAATIFRVWNQEEPWFPGDPAPSARDIVARFGLEAIQFDESVPPAWRPYYLRMLAHALTDLRSVAPTVSLRELTFRIAPLPPERRALALHQPRERRIILPPLTGAGTIAHEVAHELDRQLARRRYGQRAAYATDLGTRDGRRDRIANSVNGLNAAFGPGPGDTLATAHATRAAEIFARGFDWFVAVNLAREGRVGGYLSSFQDPAITGYGTTRGQEVGYTAVPALLELLEQVAPIGADVRRWSLERFGPNRPVSSEEIVSALRQAAQHGSPHERLAAIADVADRATGTLGATACRVTGLEDVRRLAEAQLALIQTTAEAAARGIVVDAVRAHARELEPPVSPRAADAWLAWRLDGAPEPADTALHRLADVADDLLTHWRLRRASADVDVGTGFRLRTVPTLCRGNPFASSPLRESAGPAGDLVHALLGPAEHALLNLVARRSGEPRGGRAATAYPPLGAGLPGGDPARR